MREQILQWYNLSECLPDIEPDTSKWDGRNTVKVLVKCKNYYDEIFYSIADFTVTKHWDDPVEKRDFRLYNAGFISYAIIEWAYI